MGEVSTVIANVLFCYCLFSDLFLMVGRHNCKTDAELRQG